MSLHLLAETGRPADGRYSRFFLPQFYIIMFCAGTHLLQVMQLKKNLNPDPEAAAPAGSARRRANNVPALSRHS
ncbi:hypothetical protein D3C75_537980 [compost metagenome]